MGQVRENSAEKNPLKKSKVAQFESDWLKTNGDTCTTLESHDIYRCLYGGGKLCPPPYKHVHSSMFLVHLQNTWESFVFKKNIVIG